MAHSKEPTPQSPTLVKCNTMHIAHEGTKMGIDVPQSTVDFFEDIRKPPIRSSPLQVLDHCPRKFLYEYRLGIRPRRYESALTMGTIVHKVLQALLMGRSEEEALTVCERLLSTEQQKLTEDADKAGFLPDGKDLASVLRKLEEDYHKARATAVVFWRFVPFSPEEYEVLYTPFGEPMVEMMLECKYPGLSQTIRTPCDLALVRKSDNTVWIVDYKTTSFSPRKRAIPTKISAQLALYRLNLQSHLDFWAEEGQMPRMVVAGSLHAIIKKPSIKSGTKVDLANAAKWGCDVFTAYIRRLVKWYEDENEKDPSNPPLVLDPNRFSRPLMTRELWGRLRQYCKAARSSPNVDNFYRAGESACLQYNSICPYMSLCNSDPAMWPDLVRQMYDIGFREDEEEEGGGAE